MFARTHLLRSAGVIGFILATTTAIAGADARDPADAVAVHVNVGMEITGADGVVAAGVRGRVAAGKSFGSGRVRPSVALGVVFGAGALYVDDVRALDGTLAIGYRSYGPEAQVGLRFVNGGRVDTRLFAGFALLKVDLDERLMFDAVPGVGGTTGTRASVGINWADRMATTAVTEDGDVVPSLNLGLVFLPQQVEIVWERDAGSERYGVLFAWGV